MVHVLPKNTEVFKLNCNSCTSCVKNKLAMNSAACGSRSIREGLKQSHVLILEFSWKMAPCQRNLFLLEIL